MSNESISNKQEQSSATRRMARSASIVMVAFVVSRVLGLVREAVIGAQFGTTDEYGAYVAAFRIPDLIFNLIAGGALASAFLPTFTEFLTKKQEAEGWRLASAIANWLLLVLGSASLLAALFAPLLVDYVIAPGFPAELVPLTAELMRYLLISTVIFSLSGLFMSVLHAYDRFLMPAIAPVLYNLGILFGAIFLAPSYGVIGLAWGVVLGASGHALVQLPQIRNLGAHYTFSLGRGDIAIWSSVRNVGRLMTPRVLGAAVVQLMFIANTVIASFYEPSVLTALNYAWLVMLLPHGIFASSIATVVFPAFSRMAAIGNQEGMRAGLTQTLNAVLFVVVPSAVGLFMLGEPIIQLLFERRAFTEESTQAVTWALSFYALGLVAHSLIEIINRAYFALQDTWTPVIIGTGAMIANIVLSLLLIPYIGDPTTLTRGPQGALALANTVASTVEVFILLWLLRPKMGGLDSLPLLSNFARMSIAAIVMGAVLGGLSQWELLTSLSVFLYAPIAIAIGGGVYFVMSLLLGVEEARRVPKMILRR